eukprot:tig00001033_g6484.t1
MPFFVASIPAVASQVARLPIDAAVCASPARRTADAASRIPSRPRFLGSCAALVPARPVRTFHVVCPTRAEVSRTTGAPQYERETTVIMPSYRVPLGLAAIDLALVAAKAPVALDAFVLLLALFLLRQAGALRLVFTGDSMELRTFKGDGSSSVVRSFPYAEWINWRVFWPAFPVIVFWRETKSPHFMPMLFDAAQLKEQLKDLPRLPDGVKAGQQ